MEHGSPALLLLDSDTTAGVAALLVVHGGDSVIGLWSLLAVLVGCQCNAIDPELVAPCGGLLQQRGTHQTAGVWGDLPSITA